MNFLELQIADQRVYAPSKEKFQCWVDSSLYNYDKEAELVIRIVGEQEITNLNEKYRHKKGPTNVLSFPFEVPEGIEINLLGDLVICAAIVKQEAQDQKKELDSHWAHIVIHGVLHLLGLDHIDEHDAENMEAREISILEKLNIRNPYLETDQ